MPFNFSSPEHLRHHRKRKNRVSPVSRDSPAHMNSPLEHSQFVTSAILELVNNSAVRTVCPARRQSVVCFYKFVGQKASNFRSQARQPVRLEREN